MGKLVTKAIAVAITDTLIDGPKNSRDYVGIQNLDGANPVFVSLGGKAATVLNGVRINAGELLEFLVAGNGTEIRAISTGGVVNVILISD